MLSICVLHYNHPELTDACCDALKASEVIPLRVDWLVVDHGSTVPYPAREGWRVVRLPENRGNIAGQNACFAAAEGEWVLFVSNDVRYFDAMALRWLWSYKFYGQLMPLILNPSDYTVQSSGGSYVWPGYGLNRTSASPWMRCDFCPSITYLMPKALWRSAGGFNESLPGAYEDVDMGLKVECRCLDKAKVLHQANSTLQYTVKDRWRFQVARRQVVEDHYRGVARWSRLSMLRALDGLHR